MRDSVMMRRAFVSALMVIALASVPRAEATWFRMADSSCRPVTAAERSYRDMVARAVTDANSPMSVYQVQSGLPALSDTADVYFVEDEATCLRAARALRAVFGDDTLSPPPVNVLRVGPTRYVVFNYRPIGETFYFPVFDEDFRLIRT